MIVSASQSFSQSGKTINNSFGLYQSSTNLVSSPL
jgi:hypothetical protein